MAVDAAAGPSLETMRESLRAFLDGPGRVERTTAVHDVDADGIAAGVVWLRAMERLGRGGLALVAPDRERNAWTPANRARAAASDPRALFVLDLGSRPEPVIPGVPACLIDHHRPMGTPPGALLLSGYELRPIPPAAVLVHELLAPRTDLRDVEWIAALGAVGDLGISAPFEGLKRAKRAHGARALQESAALLNAPRRSSRHDPETAARALLGHRDPEALLASRSPDVERLREAREEVRAELDRVKRVPPVFAGRVALFIVRSPCQVHPVLATIWSRRLRDRIVIAANEEYLPGRVNFSVRTALDEDLIGFLDDLGIPSGEGTFAGGHDRATGGSLPRERWQALLSALRF